MRVHQNPNVEGASDVVLDKLRTDTLNPALASIPNACRYMGGVSRAKFYSDILPALETVHIGTRHFVVVASMDSLIAALRRNSPPQTIQGSKDRRGITPKARTAATPHSS
jgi:hypothetical protein